uniref:Uncharacterized protein n=1 Tax=Anguilla anguilla TaxID=7936 RepID=A0A0E9RFP2_ANGAN
MNFSVIPLLWHCILVVHSRRILHLYKRAQTTLTFSRVSTMAGNFA